MNSGAGVLAEEIKWFSRAGNLYSEVGVRSPGRRFDLLGGRLSYRGADIRLWTGLIIKLQGGEI